MNKTILVIDDDDILRRSLTKGLRADGFFVITANSAETAGEILARVVPDAIVLDRMMTGMNGAEALQKWRASGMSVPVIILTAMSGPENTIAGLIGGADDYMAKPFQLQELVLRLHNITTRRSGVPAPTLPDGLVTVDGEFYIGNSSEQRRLFALSSAEKEFLTALVSPVGNVASAAPMVAKRLREKLLAALAGVDIITVRGKGYKLVTGK